jgi:phage terminase large subunit
MEWRSTLAHVTQETTKPHTLITFTTPQHASSMEGCNIRHGEKHRLYTYRCANWARKGECSAPVCYCTCRQTEVAGCNNVKATKYNGLAVTSNRRG